MFDIPAGQPIPGSKFFRDYCRRCGEAMRVTESKLESVNYCEECDPTRPGDISENLTPRQRAKLGKTRS